MNIVYNQDCMSGMAETPDKFYDLCICDPPYFKGVASVGFYGEKISKTGVKRGDYKSIEYWDKNIPGQEYFAELYRISKHQIVWGINYYEGFALNSGRIIWDKVNDDSSFSKAEIASCSFHDSVQMFRYMWNGMLQGDMKNKEKRIHPTQKPVALYKWLIQNYAKPGDKILDTHVGSGSIRIACDELGYEFTGYEIDEDYWKAQEKRFSQHKSQLKLFV